jgi:hypothetical protein
MKLKLRLVKTEVEALTKILGMAFQNAPMDQLKEQPHEYAIMSSVFEVWEKVSAKAQNLALFHHPIQRPITITLTRTQALALDVVINVHDTADDVVQPTDALVPLRAGSYEWDLARRICEQVYITYYQ